MPDSPAMSFSESMDPFGAISTAAEQLLQSNRPSEVAAKLSGRKIKRIASAMKTKWDTLIDDVTTLKGDVKRLVTKEKAYDALVEKDRRKNALLKFRHAISVFRKKVVAKKMNMDWDQLHKLLDEPNVMSNLKDVLKDCKMSISDWNILTKISRDGSDVAHPKFSSSEDIKTQLDCLSSTISTEDKDVLERLIFTLDGKCNLGDEIIEQRRKNIPVLSNF